MPQTNLATKRAKLALQIDVGGVYETVTFGLTQEPLTPGPQTTLAMCAAVECDFAGYARQGPAVWGSIFDAGQSLAAVYAQLLQWDCTDDTDPQDAYAVFWVAGGALVGFEQYDSPQPARAAFDAIVYLPRLTEPS